MAASMSSLVVDLAEYAYIRAAQAICSIESNISIVKSHNSRLVVNFCVADLCKMSLDRPQRLFRVVLLLTDHL